MAAKNDEHVHHPICEACGKQFADTNQLSTHIDEQHRKSDTWQIEIFASTYRERC